MDTKERIRARYAILNKLCSEPEYKAPREQLESISPEALEDLLWLGFVKQSGREIVAKKHIAEKWKRLWGEGSDETGPGASESRSSQ